MDSEPFDELRARYEDQHDAMLQFQRAVERSLNSALKGRSVEAVVSGRVKTLDSIRKKLLRKPDHTWESLSDKIGIRVITNDPTTVREVVRETFQCNSEDDKSLSLGEDRLGYPGIHFDIELRSDDPSRSEFIALKMQAEIQVRTFAQHAWCDVSHRFDYKNDSAHAIPPLLRRKLLLTAGLLEMAEATLREVGATVNELPAFQSNRVLEALEGIYFDFTSRAPNRELSRYVLASLSRLYTSPDELLRRVRSFVDRKRDIIRQVFDRNEKVEIPRAALFFQPESLAIWELLENNLDAIRAAWIEILPHDELSNLATEFGLPIE